MTKFDTLGLPPISVAFNTEVNKFYNFLLNLKQFAVNRACLIDYYNTSKSRVKIKFVDKKSIIHIDGFNFNIPKNIEEKKEAMENVIDEYLVKIVNTIQHLEYNSGIKTSDQDIIKRLVCIYNTLQQIDNDLIYKNLPKIVELLYDLNSELKKIFTKLGVLNIIVTNKIDENIQYKKENIRSKIKNTCIQYK